MKETTLDGKTPDIAEENIQKLRQIFPDVFTEDKVDFEKLQQVLGNYVEDSNERYNFIWNGKGRALRLSQTPSLGTLRPCKEESKDWDTTQNLYIEGDNLEVLKLLQKSYHSKVKMIYIDPPYNTGKDFVYPDDFHDSLENYKKITGQVDSEGNRVGTNTEASGRYHTDWLNMMYPRLRLARNLLTDDGVVCIQIDDNENCNLEKLCNEIFGEENLVSKICIKMSHLSGMKMAHKEKKVPKIKEYILIYSKNIDAINIKPVYVKGSWDSVLERYTGFIENYEDEITAWKRVSLNNKIKELELGEQEVETFKLNNAQRIFRTAVNDSLKEYQKDDTFYKVVTPTGLEKLVYNREEVLFASSKLVKFTDGLYPAEYIGDIWTDIGINNLHNEGGVNFPNGKKPIKLLNRLISMFADRDSIILDFFSGSATTAHATIQINGDDGGRRKFIMVQIPELIEEKNELYRFLNELNKPVNICEIGKERIRRAGEKIKEEKGLEAQNLDIGFKVLKLDTSNIRKWQPDYDNLEQSILDYVDNYVAGRTELDVVYEIMLKYGLDLTYPVDEFTVAQKKVYSIGFGMLMICLDNEITTEVAKGILEKIKELAPESTRVVFKDNGFKTDSNKTNIKEILKCGGIEEFITL